jgi:hypothetical protein
MLTLTSAGKTALLNALPLWEKAQQSSTQQLGDQRWPVVQKAFADLINKMHRTTAP